MKAKLASEYFRCPRADAVLQRERCAQVYRIAAKPRAAKGDLSIASSAAHLRCAGCPIGAEHSQGKAGAPAVPAPTPIQAASRDKTGKRCFGCGKPLHRGRRRSHFCDHGCKVAETEYDQAERSLTVIA